MKHDQIMVGHFYVNKAEDSIREVLSYEEGKVQWLGYCLRDGSSDGYTSFCETYSLANWAGREATSEEVARMDIINAHRKAQKRASDFTGNMIRTVIENVSPNELLAEIQRRKMMLWVLSLAEDEALLEEAHRRGLA